MQKRTSASHADHAQATQISLVSRGLSQAWTMGYVTWRQRGARRADGGRSAMLAKKEAGCVDGLGRR